MTYKHLQLRLIAITFSLLAALSTASAVAPVSPAATSVGQAAATMTLSLRVQEAVEMALANNVDFAMEKLNPKIQMTNVTEERAAFEDSLSVTGQVGSDHGNSTINDEEKASLQVSLQKSSPNGTTISAGLSRYDSSSSQDYSSLDVTITRALLRGGNKEANLARLRSAQAGVTLSQYELKAAAETLIALVELAYWDLALAQRQVEIFADSMKVAKQQLDYAQERVNIGRLAQRELAAVEAEVASRQEDLINAKSNVEKGRITLLQLLQPKGQNFWHNELKLQERINNGERKIDSVAAHVALALKLRPDINQARLELKLRNLEVIRTKNGLLPRLDLFLSLGSSSYTRSFFHHPEDSSSDITFGFAFQQGLGRRGEKAQAQRAKLMELSQQQAVQNLQLLAQREVRLAYIEVQRAIAQVAASKATRKYREQSSLSEEEKFALGKSTTLLLAQASRDLVGAKVTEIGALIALQKALINLYLTEGSLLERQAVAIGAEA